VSDENSGMTTGPIHRQSHKIYPNIYLMTKVMMSQDNFNDMS